MFDSVHEPGNDFPSARSTHTPAQSWQDHWSALAASTILVLGFPRSGTTWLAKIFDSHPDVLYRHEPDELSSTDPGLAPAAQIRAWLLQRGLRAAGKRPNFPKSWRPALLTAVRTGLAGALAAAQRLLPTARLAAQIGLPDLVLERRWQQVRAVIKLVAWDGTVAARAMPETRCIFILRHPCGQIASVMAGLSARYFDNAIGTAADLAAAAAHAGRRGIDRAAFEALPDAAKFAWSWLAFNEAAIESLGKLPNARVVLYEDLCRDPVVVSRDLFAFAGLDWHPQTEAFLGASTSHQPGSGYFDVFRASEDTAERWRQSMDPQDQESVRAVVCTSSLARCWPDLAPAPAPTPA
jgi:hypothetical protein